MNQTKTTSYIGEIICPKMVIKDPVDNIMYKPSSQDFHMRRSMRGMEEHETYPVGYVARRNTSGWTRSILSPLSHNTRARDVCFIWISWEWSNVEGLSYQNLKDSNVLSQTNCVHLEEKENGRTKYYWGRCLYVPCWEQVHHISTWSSKQRRSSRLQAKGSTLLSVILIPCVLVVPFENLHTSDFPLYSPALYQLGYPCCAFRKWDGISLYVWKNPCIAWLN